MNALSITTLVFVFYTSWSVLYLILSQRTKIYGSWLCFCRFCINLLLKALRSPNFTFLTDFIFKGKDMEIAEFFVNLLTVDDFVNCTIDRYFTPTFYISLFFLFFPASFLNVLLEMNSSWLLPAILNLKWWSWYCISLL